MTDLSPLKAARRERLLDTAERLFVAQGFRATTMEGMAEAAGLSKVTVYGYFRDKDAAFEAVARRLADRMRKAVLAELDAEGLPAGRVTAALNVKHGIVHDLVGTSAFATELMAQKLSVGRIFADLDADITARIADLLGDVQAARILFDGAMGIAGTGAPKAQMQADIARLVAALSA